jgi:hypothetical protein
LVSWEGDHTLRCGRGLTMPLCCLYRIECFMGMVASKTNTCGGMSMEISVIELVLMHAAQRACLMRMPSLRR